MLDEVGDLRPEAQGALLRSLDTGEVRALGSRITRRIDCGIVAATLRPLAEHVNARLFRRDLYFRLAQGVVVLPPSRERLEDLVPLMEVLWARIQPDRSIPGWLMRATHLEVLRQHTWPGNVRELLHLLRRLSALDGPLSEGRLRALLSSLPGGTKETPTPEPRKAPPVPKSYSRQEITEALHRAGGCRKTVYRQLGVSRSTLYRAMRSFGLD